MVKPQQITKDETRQRKQHGFMNNESTPRNTSYKETTNLSFAAFAYMQGLRIIRAAERRGPGNMGYSFGFDDPDNHWDSLNFEFANSESSRFDNAVRTLKKLCKRNGHG